MINILNKFALFIAIGIIGYLAYSSLKEPASSLAGESKEIPVVTKKMFIPVFVTPENRSSPVSRDPFNVGGDSNVSPLDSLAGKKVGADNGTNADFPGKLMGIISGADRQQLALIGGEIYGVGSSIKLPNSNETWRVDAINEESVLLTCNEMRTVLKISNGYSDPNDSNDSNNVETNIYKTTGQEGLIK